MMARKNPEYCMLRISWALLCEETVLLLCCLSLYYFLVSAISNALYTNNLTTHLYNYD